jgi:hypothetical protein
VYAKAYNTWVRSRKRRIRYWKARWQRELRDICSVLPWQKPRWIWVDGDAGEVFYMSGMVCAGECAGD